jgi:hypothetical protein
VNVVTLCKFLHGECGTVSLIVGGAEFFDRFLSRVGEFARTLLSAKAVDNTMVFFLLITSVEILYLANTQSEAFRRFLVREFSFMETLDDTDTSEFIAREDDFLEKFFFFSSL